MTVRQALELGSGLLSTDQPAPSFGEQLNPGLDASLLLASLLGCSRARLLASLPDELPTPVLTAFRELIQRRLGGESVAYILGTKEFYGRDFRVDPRVLVPRPETELLVDLAIQRLDSLARSISGPSTSDPAVLDYHDTCTGSGCVGLSVAAERPSVRLSLSDLSAPALELAAENARLLLQRPVPLYRSNLLETVPGSFHLITANPPYVRSELSDAILGRGSHEPRLALDGGPDGLAVYRRLAGEAVARLGSGGWLLVEIGEEQGRAVRDLFAAAGLSDIEVAQDLAGLDRVVAGCRYD